VERPSRAELERIAEAHGFDLSAAELDAFTELAGRYLTAYDRLDEMREPVVVPVRPGSASAREGWVWQGAVAGAPSGPLLGRRIAVKDNICLAGVPMACGSPVLDGYVPERDATVVRRVPAAGPEIVGKTACRAFWLEAAGRT